MNEGTIMNKAVLLFQYEERRCREGVGERTMNQPVFGFSTDRKANSSVRKVMCVHVCVLALLVQRCSR